MWAYHISSGKIFDPSGALVGLGYSGRGVHKNSPEAQSLKDQGPIPEGYYHIGEPHDSVTHGPFVLPLAPDPQNVMFGRDSFLIHGDSISAPGTASKGCIIASRSIRENIARSLDKVLLVMSGEFTLNDDTGLKSG